MADVTSHASSLTTLFTAKVGRKRNTKNSENERLTPKSLKLKASPKVAPSTSQSASLPTTARSAAVAAVAEEPILELPGSQATEIVPEIVSETAAETELEIAPEPSILEASIEEVTIEPILRTRNPTRSATIIPGAEVKRLILPNPKTTKTFELRRKAGEELVKERRAKKAAEKKLYSTLIPEKPLIERKKTIATEKTPRIPPKVFIPSTIKRSPTSSNPTKRLNDILYPQERSAPITKSVEVQTCSAEINDNTLLIGDVKIMTPSPKLWADILKKRAQDLQESCLREERQIPEHSKDEVHYQSNLKVFLESGAVAKSFARKPKKGEERKDVFKRAAERPKVQPEMDLKKRLKTIEGELLNVYQPRA